MLPYITVPFRVLILFVAVSLSLILSPASGAEEKIPTSLTIALDPANPGEGVGFYVTGTLTTDAGDPLGNKWVVLESTAAGARPGTFQYLTVVRTEEDGSYRFYRPAASPPEDLRTVFKGIYGYESSTSDEVSARR